MGRKNKSLLRLLLEESKDITTLLIVISVVIVAIIMLIVWIFHSTKISIENENHASVSETQIQALKDIGEWEFLAINDEELIDTIHKGIFSDHELTRIYYGTLRLGINMHEVKDGWIYVNNDTIFATLPPIQLLDSNFIDEARTTTFFEVGKWNQQTRARMYDKAKALMLRRCMTKSNIQSAEQNVSSQFYQILQSMGFEHIKIKFDTSQQ